MAGTLRRELGLVDAVLVGLGSMVGAGIFVVFSPAAAVAGSGLLVGLLVAAVIAFANATSTAQLAAAHPSSGGAYLFGRLHLGPWWGYLAGCGFLIGKTASCAAMALTFASYVAPPGWRAEPSSLSAPAFGHRQARFGVRFSWSAPVPPDMAAARSG